MKLTPFARRSRSSAIDKPSTMPGALATSSVVKNHWFGLRRAGGGRGGLAVRAGEAVGGLRRE